MTTSRRSLLKTSGLTVAALGLGHRFARAQVRLDQPNQAPGADRRSRKACTVPLGCSLQQAHELIDGLGKHGSVHATGTPEPHRAQQPKPLPTLYEHGMENTDDSRPTFRSLLS